MTGYDEKLQELQAQMASKNRLETKLNALRKQKAELEEKVAELESIMYKEQSDVESLERRSLAKFFYQVVGKMDEKLTRERQEAYEAAVSFEVASKELAAVKEDLRAVELEYGRVRRSKEMYEEVLQQKIAAMKLQGTPEAGRIEQLEEELTQLAKQEKGVSEAISAGQSALSIVDSILKSLSEAEGYGKWDMLGGGILADVGKYGSLEQAQHKVERLQIALRRFQTELVDVKLEVDIQINVDGFTRFANFFFDGLLADWAAMDSIKGSMYRVQDTEKQLERVMTRLKAMMNEIKARQAGLQGELSSLARP